MSTTPNSQIDKAATLEYRKQADEIVEKERILTQWDQEETDEAFEGVCDPSDAKLNNPEVKEMFFKVLMARHFPQIRSTGNMAGAEVIREHAEDLYKEMQRDVQAGGLLTYDQYLARESTHIADWSLDF